MSESSNTDKILTRLAEGNLRYVSSRMEHPNQGEDRRAEVSKGQHPVAVIVGCSDSRIPPEIVFDQGLGDLFVIRVAGNILDDLGLGSIEYAVEHLHAPLIVVAGSGSGSTASAASRSGSGFRGARRDGRQHLCPGLGRQEDPLSERADAFDLFSFYAL